MSMLSVNYGFWDAWLDPIRVTFDGTNKLILINYGENTIDVQRDIFSAWKRWAEQIDNLKFPLALTVVGGDPIDQTNVITPYYFLMNGWRLRPYEGSHSLTITGIILTNDNQDPLVPTLSPWNISVTRIVPIKAESVLSGGGTAPTAEQNAAAVWNALLATYAAQTAGGKLRSLENTVLPMTYPLSDQDKTDITTGVWVKPTITPFGVGTMGEKLKSQQNITTQDKTDIAIEVWNQPTTATYQVNSFGEFFKVWVGTKLLTISKFLALK